MPWSMRLKLAWADQDQLVLSDLGVVHYQLGSYPDAIKYLKQAVALD